MRGKARRVIVSAPGQGRGFLQRGENDMAIEWKEDTPDVANHAASIEFRGMRISVTEHEDGKIWQCFIMSFGELSLNTETFCRHYWPAKAIAEARARLDEFENQLGDGNDE